jgi:hypothetical protein
VSTDDHTDEPSSADQAPAQRYEIRVKGHLGSRWATRFDGLSLTAEDDGTTVIRGAVVDQAALHGVLQTLRDFGITLLSLMPLAPGRADEPLDNSDIRIHHHSRGATP